MRADIAPGGTHPTLQEFRASVGAQWTFLSDPDRTVQHDLRAVTSEIRPDWDLSTPGLREAWDAGDFSPLHGWNKRAGQKPAPV